jgi:hypothetical protein
VQSGVCKALVTKTLTLKYQTPLLIGQRRIAATSSQQVALGMWNEDCSRFAGTAPVKEAIQNTAMSETQQCAFRFLPLQHPLMESLACCLRQIRKNLIEEETYMKNRLHTVTRGDGEWAQPEDMASQGLDAILTMRHAICFKLFFHGGQQQ